MKFFKLSKYKKLFLDDTSYNKFVELIKNAKEFTPIMLNQKVVGHILSADTTKKIIIDKHFKNLGIE